MENELYHDGVKGMRWGVRRYQNKDGSLTSAGKKRYGTKSNFEKVQSAKRAATNKIKTQKAKDKANARTQAEIEKYQKKASKKSNKKNIQEQNENSIKDLTDAELIKRTNRLNAEKNLIEAQKNHLQAQQQFSALQPKKINKGKELAERLVKDVFAPQVVDLGTKYIEKKLGLKDNSLDMLKKEAEKAGYQKKIYEAKDAAYKNIKNEREEAKYQANMKKESEEAKKAEKEAKKAEKEKVYSGTVEGEGTSKRTEKSKYSTDDYVDADFRETNNSDINNGKNFINSFLLEDKNMKHSEVFEIGNQNELYYYGVMGMKLNIQYTSKGKAYVSKLV